MFSLSAIPEPSNNAPDTAAPDTPQVPLATAASEGRLAPVETADLTTKKLDADQQVDGIAVMLVLLIAGALLRLVLGLLGPLQGINAAAAEQAQQQGKAVLANESNNAWPGTREGGPDQPDPPAIATKGVTSTRTASSQPMERRKVSCGLE